MSNVILNLSYNGVPVTTLLAEAKRITKPLNLAGLQSCCMPLAKDVVLTRTAAGDLLPANLKHCQMKHACPVCLLREGFDRMHQFRAVLDHWRDVEGCFAAHVVLTTYRDPAYSAAHVNGLFYEAWANLATHGYRTLARRAGIVGVIWAHELVVSTHWGPHRHLIVVFREPVDLGKQRGGFLHELHPVWDGALRDVGLFCDLGDEPRTGGLYATPVRDRYVCDYITKSGTKMQKPDEKGRGPLTLLAQSLDGDTAAAKLYRDYVSATMGRQRFSMPATLMAPVRDDLDEEREEWRSRRAADEENIITVNRDDWRDALHAGAVDELVRDGVLVGAGAGA